MKNIVILDCGPSLPDVSRLFGYAPKWIMEILANTDCSFNWVKSYFGETVNPQDGDAWIITGSPRSVNDENDWMLDLENCIRKSAEINIPVLGICFGHQLIAKSFGGRVELNPNGWELGTYPIQLTDEGVSSSLFVGFDNHAIVNESHQDCVTSLPENAVELAFNKKGNQAFKLHESMFAVQFHPEFSWEVIKKYVSARSAAGVQVDDPSVPESTQGQLVLHNFIDLIY